MGTWYVRVGCSWSHQPLTTASQAETTIGFTLKMGTLKHWVKMGCAKATQLSDNKIHFCFINISQYNDYPLGYIKNFLGGLVVKNSPDNAGAARDMVSIPGSGRSPGEGNGNPLQYSCLENLMDRGAWWATVHGAAKSWTLTKQLSTHTHPK